MWNPFNWFSSSPKGQQQQQQQQQLKDPSCLYLGICGSTRSGKSTLTRNLCRYLGLDKRKVLELDEYFDIEKLRSNVKPDDKYLNWEVPEALAFDRFVYDFTHNARDYIQPLRSPITAGSITYRSIFISEGFLLFEPKSDAEVLRLFDKFIFVGCSREVCKKRRMETKRETEEYFDTLIWPNYLKYNHALYPLKKTGELEQRVLGGGEFKVIDGCKNDPAQVLSSALDFLASKERTEQELAEEDAVLLSLYNEYKQSISQLND